jgi:hypothetical protein
MWAYLGSSYPDRPSSEELSVVEVEDWIHKVLNFGVNLAPGAGPVPLRSGIASIRVSSLGPIYAASAILSFHYACDLEQVLEGSHGESLDAHPPVNAAGQEVRHTSNEAT